MIYLDNAATSFPKPPETIDSLNSFLTSIGGNPGRGGNPLSIEAARIVFDARQKLTQFISGKASERLIFTRNGTEALNLSILGILKEKDHVITTSLEHNSVMRPLDFLQKTRGIEVDIIECSRRGELDLNKVADAIKGTTRMVIVNHGSNIIGSVQPIREIRDAIGDLLLVVDACQTIGVIPIDVDAQGIDVLCFSCHKSLYGIQGLGALYLKEGIEPVPLVFGGTGSKSEFVHQPEMLPDKYESGTSNTPAIAALSGGLSFIERIGVEQVRAKKKELQTRLVKRLSEVDGVEIHGDPLNPETLPITSFSVDGSLPSDIGYECNHAGICVRVGLHCAPLAHETIHTFPGGTIRVSPGYFNTSDEIDILIDVVRKHAKH